MNRFLLLVTIVLLSCPVFANNQFVVRSKSAKVYEKPSTRSEVLYTLRSGNKVHVLGINQQGWAKVKINLDGNFGFTGWMFKSSLGVEQNLATAKPKEEPKKRVSDLEKFFEPTQNSQELSPRVKEKKKSKTKKASKEKSSSKPRSEMAALDTTWKTEVLTLVARPSWALHQYNTLQNGSKVFSYTLSGPSVYAGVHAKAPALFNQKLYTSVDLGAEYGFLHTTTNLRDGGGDQFGSLTSKNKMFGFDAKANFLIEASQTPQGRILVGPTVGYRYLKFKADDIVDDNDVRSGLFVTSQRSGVTLGLHSEISTFPPFLLIIGSDFGISQSFKESPEDFSGTDPSAKMLYAPYLALRFPLKRPHQFLALSYSFEYQKVNFTGNSTQDRAGVPLADATVEQLFHLLGVTYTFAF
ncbi:MAG: SH3 domain-containing protein [Bdellovibrionales bacterium]|nr:SH3 domain-containing protein [Bdellovibrionales bacterium]